ncbi:MAG: Stk1 family PASTA domain-containing Ser/Thr kinase [Eubacterium sp.]|nr:Stk1 family PASTA domain-containing Ser/Thr kinase [Eubacterium sp.]
MLKPGTILDERYEIIDVVGTGGMSTVYRAKDHRLKRYVAVKVLKTEYSNDANFVSKFRVEAQASAGLTHPNIVSVYDVCEDNGRYFIVMELVEGITLKEYINLNGRLTMDQALDFSMQIASGLEAAHEHHVIHRDIKPQNIIVSKNGNLKVTDFGIAKAATSNTMSTAGMGSVHYISPEQARGGYSDERSDIYSMGITMYEMVTGRVPFEGDTNVAIALMHIQNEIIPPRELYPDIYSSFEKIIMKATQKKPERRYLTAAALIADLKRVKANPNIDIIVAPAATPNGPTQQFTDSDFQKIKTEVELHPVQPGQTSAVTPDRERLNRLINEAEEDDYGYEEEVRQPQPRRQSVKKVPDEDDYGYDYDYQEQPQEEEEDVDPKLAKAVMIGGIAAAVIIFVIVFIVIGNVMGWFKFGKSEDKTTVADTATGTATTQEKEEVVREMIDVVGLRDRAAEKSLKDAGFFNIKIETVNDDKVQAEYVISQNYKKGDKLPESTEIVITVSLGAEEVTVPDVSTYTDEQATQVLKEAGFEVLHSYEFSDTVEKDKIIKTNPEKNTKAAKGSKVTLVVSNGKEVKTVKVPKVTGISESAATSSLSAVNLSVGNVTHENSDDVESGLVIRQSQPEGTEVEEGTKIDIVISDGPKVVTYTGSVSGSVSTSASEVMDTPEGVTVVVYISDSDGDHQVTSASVDVLDKGSISLSGSVNGLNSSNGTIKISVISSGGEDVTQYYQNSLTLTFTPE